MSSIVREAHVLKAVDAGASGRLEQVQDWLAGHGIDPNRVYRVEMYARDGQLLARIYEFERDQHGKHFVRDGDIARRDPYIVTARSPMPLTVPLVIPAGAELPESSA